MNIYDWHQRLLLNLYQLTLACTGRTGDLWLRYNAFTAGDARR
jgi:hypothetical protein